MEAASSSLASNNARSRALMLLARFTSGFDLKYVRFRSRMHAWGEA
jgi:hypothetical protein